jgi:hypothetical protein
VLYQLCSNWKHKRLATEKLRLWNLSNVKIVVDFCNRRAHLPYFTFIPAGRNGWCFYLTNVRVTFSLEHYLCCVRVDVWSLGLDKDVIHVISFACCNGTQLRIYIVCRLQFTVWDFEWNFGFLNLALSYDLVSLAAGSLKLQRWNWLCRVFASWGL